eukprot:scaffold314345_cov15-Tisochrysis_lutea.AAC.1
MSLWCKHGSKGYTIYKNKRREGLQPINLADSRCDTYCLGLQESGLQGSTTPPIGSYPNRVQSIKSRSRAQQSRWVYGHTVHGVVHLLSKDDWARVQLSEGILPPFSQVLQVG